MRLMALFILLLSGVVCACLPECHPDYAEWVNVGMPASWCYARQCRGDADGLATGSPIAGYTYVDINDLTALMSSYLVKEPPEGPGIIDFSADFDHRASGSPYIGYHRIGTNDYCIFAEFYGVKEPPQGPGVPECDGVCPIENDVIDGPQLSLRVKTDTAWEDTDIVFVTPETSLEIGIVNASGDKCTCYDAYLSTGSGSWEDGGWQNESSWVYDPVVFQWTDFGTTVSGLDTWYLETKNPTASGDPVPGSVSASLGMWYSGYGEKVINVTLYNEYFEVVDTLRIQETLPECHPDYDEWISIGAPPSWCIPRQCKGDVDNWLEGGGCLSLGCSYVFYYDLATLLAAFKIKEPPEGSGLTIDLLVADFDHKQAGSPYTGYHRVGTTDACIFGTYYGIKEPPRGPGIDPDCTECDTPGAGLQGPQLSLQVSVAGGAFQDTDLIEVGPNTVLQIGINNTTPDAINFYDGYISIAGGHEYGSWTGNNWVYDPTYFNWTYFGTSPIVDKDTWYMETHYAWDWATTPSGITSWVEYLYNTSGSVTIELYNEFFELQDTLTIQGGCYAGMPDYDEWISVGAPDCWCYRRNCNGDTDGLSEGNAIVGYKYLFNLDLCNFLDSYGVKEPPKGPGVASRQGCTANGICADFDRQLEGNGITGFKRVFNNDLAILLAHYGVKEPPKGPGVPECEGLFYFVDP